MSNKLHPLILAAFLALASGCAKETASLPAPTANPGSSNNVAPYNDGSGNPGGGVGTTTPCTPVAPTTLIKSYIKRNARLTAAANNWEIVTTITPPDGFTYGLGCNNVYPFSVDISYYDDLGYPHSTYASGTYNYGNGAFEMSR